MKKEAVFCDVCGHAFGAGYRPPYRTEPDVLCLILRDGIKEYEYRALDVCPLCRALIMDVLAELPAIQPPMDEEENGEES